MWRDIENRQIEIINDKGNTIITYPTMTTTAALANVSTTTAAGAASITITVNAPYYSTDFLKFVLYYHDSDCVA